MSNTAAPVSETESLNGDQDVAPVDGVALCLSGGGYRAMLYHVGALLRLNEFGILKKLTRVSSVSGGSITAAVLGLNWKNLQFDAQGRATNLRANLVVPIRKMADTTVDRGSILGGILLPGSVSERVASQYREILFGNKTLQDLPDDTQGPRFIINATSVQTGSLVRFSRPYVADYKVGRILNPMIGLAEAVAASSAFPPFLSPAEIDVNPADFEVDPKCPLQKLPYTDSLVLTDGGVYDNLGLETAWKNCHTVLVSDGGGKMQPEPSPAGDWAQHSKRILDIVDDQVRNLRKRWLMDSYKSSSRAGTYWGIRSDIAKYKVPNSLAAPVEKTRILADLETRLKRTPIETQNRLMNWGYAICDAAIRAHAPQLISPETPELVFPFDHGVG